jgi:hypothetical protein
MSRSRGDQAAGLLGPLGPHPRHFVRGADLAEHFVGPLPQRGGGVARARQLHGVVGGALGLRPAGQVPGRLGLAAQQVRRADGLADLPGRLRQPRLPLLPVPHPAAAAAQGQQQHRRGQGGRQPVALALLGGHRLRHLPGAGLLLRPGLGGGPLHLDPAEPVRHRVEVARHRLGHRPGVGRPPARLGRQARSGQPDQLCVGPALLQPGVRPLQAAASRLGLRLPRHAVEGRLAGQHLAEDRPQAEHVGPLIDLPDVAARLLRRHVGRRPQHAPRHRLRVSPLGRRVPFVPRRR